MQGNGPQIYLLYSEQIAKADYNNNDNNKIRFFIVCDKLRAPIQTKKAKQKLRFIIFNNNENNNKII
jgi:hypothetical protein